MKRIHLILTIFAIAIILNFQIVQAEATVTTPYKLPIPRDHSSAVWYGSNAYIFGGSDGTNQLDDIVRFNPTSGTVTTLASTLPSGRSTTSAIWDGSNAYIFGGSDGTNRLDDIVMFNPSAGTVTTLTSTLPTARYYTSAIWGSAYIFGGNDASGNLDDIVRFDPSVVHAPPSYSGWVGGELYGVNKLAVVAPFLAIIGVVAIVTTLFVSIRRHKA